MFCLFIKVLSIIVVLIQPALPLSECDHALGGVLLHLRADVEHAPEAAVGLPERVAVRGADFCGARPAEATVGALGGLLTPEAEAGDDGHEFGARVVLRFILGCGPFYSLLSVLSSSDSQSIT